MGLGVSEGLQQWSWGFLSRVTVESGVCTNALGHGVRDVGAKPGVVLGVTIRTNLANNRLRSMSKTGFVFWGGNGF